jgi:small-conductance mechanosensitive channel
MDFIKRILGVIWLLMAIASAYFCVFVFGLPKLNSGKQEDLVFGIIILFILTPLVVVGLSIFGYYSLKGEYSKINI